MTNSQIVLVTISTIIFISLLIEGYKMFILKKKNRKRPRYLFMLIFLLFYFMLFWNADYFYYDAISQREKYGIPPVEESMILLYRSRFKE